MANEGPPGVSASQVQSMINSAVRPLEGNISRLDSRLSALENEMSSIANAISSMSNQVSNKLDALHSTTRSQLEGTNSRLADANHRLLEVQKTTENGLARNAEVSAAGFTASTAATAMVGSDVQLNTSSVDRNTAALVQMEFLRIYAEGQMARRKITGFSAEVEERFNKALESVVLNRHLYDKHFESIHNEYESKVRTIGEHIYRILEEDFVPMVEARLQVPRPAFQQLALAVDEARIHSRSEQLDASLAQVRKNVLDPLLNQHQSFEQQLAQKFSLDGGGSAEGEVLVPAAVTVGSDGAVTVVVDAALRTRANGDLRFSLAPRNRLPSLARQLQSDQALLALAGQMNWRNLGKTELDGVSTAIDQLATQGLLDRAFAAGLQRYLSQFGLRVSEHGVAANSGWLGAAAPMQAGPAAQPEAAAA